MELRCCRHPKAPDDGMVSVEIALGTFSIVIMIALVLSVFAAAMTTQNSSVYCTSAGIHESACGGNGQETARVMSARIAGAHFEFSADERWFTAKRKLL